MRPIRKSEISPVALCTRRIFGSGVQGSECRGRSPRTLRSWHAAVCFRRSASEAKGLHESARRRRSRAPRPVLHLAARARATARHLQLQRPAPLAACSVPPRPEDSTPVGAEVAERNDQSSAVRETDCARAGLRPDAGVQRHAHRRIVAAALRRRGQYPAPVHARRPDRREKLRLSTQRREILPDDSRQC